MSEDVFKEPVSTVRLLWAWALLYLFFRVTGWVLIPRRRRRG